VRNAEKMLLRILLYNLRLQVLELTSKNVFVPLCIGGGIRAYKDSKGVDHTALDVASAYFRSGADKVSIGSDAVYAAREHRSLTCDQTAWPWFRECVNHMYPVVHIPFTFSLVLSVNGQFSRGELDVTQLSTVLMGLRMGRHRLNKFPMCTAAKRLLSQWTPNEHT
jgi:hypothetical protein